MKHSLLFVSIATFFITCGVSDINGINENTNYVPDVPQIAVKERPCEILEYVGKIGNDFDSALDSLRKLPGGLQEMTWRPLEVLFDLDDRGFYDIMYGNCKTYIDVLDTKGNYYIRPLWPQSCMFENNLQEELIFKENTVFTINPKECMRIAYQGRAGSDFDDALEVLERNIYEPLFEWLAEPGCGWGWPPYNGEGYVIERWPININFDHDDRTFTQIIVSSRVGTYWEYPVRDVIDSNGNHFEFQNLCSD